MEYKLVIAVRKDLKLSQGKLAVQASHASVQCALTAKKKNPKWFRDWYDEGQRKVVVKVDSLNELFELKRQAEEKSIPAHLITDAGLTEVPPGTVTCLGIGPAPEDIIDKITGNLQLL